MVMGEKYVVSICGPDLIDAYERQVLSEIYSEYRGKERVVYTAGYEGKSVEEFTKALKEKAVERVLDVRETPWSRRKDFSKENIRKELKKAGIEYLSFRELGTPREIRKKLKTGSMSFEQFAEAYRSYVAKNENSLLMLKILASEKTSAIMCYEADWRNCHRAVLAEFLERDGFKVVHL